MKRGDIYLVSLDPTAGHEQSGSRPVLIVSPAEFNDATKLPVILPITNGGEFARRLGFAVPVTGIKTTGVVRCDQPRVIDLAARHARKVDTLPAPLMEEVLAKVATLFEEATPMSMSEFRQLAARIDQQMQQHGRVLRTAQTQGDAIADHGGHA